jgi:hypothetical protein
MTTQNIFDLADTWNDGATTFSAIKMNVTDTASASGSLLMDLQVGGVSRFSVKKNGDINIISGATVTSSNLIYFGGGGQTGINSAFSVNSQALTVNGAKYLGWGSNAAATADVQLFRDAADTLAQRRSTNPQAFRVYNTYTDASNYERGFMRWNSNVLRIGTEKAGTGSARALELQTDGTTRLTIGTDDVITHSYASASGGFIVQSSQALGAGSGGSINIYATPLPTAANQKLGQFLFGSTSGGVKNSAAVTAFSNASWSAGSSHPTYIAFATTDSGSATRAERMRITPSGLLTFGGGSTSSFPALKRNGTALNVRLADDSADAPVTASTVTATNATDNTSGLAISGYSLTGTSAVSMVDLAGTWNTTGTPTAVKLNVTDTASASGSLLMDLQVGGVSQFNVTKAGMASVRAGSYNNPGLRFGTTGSTGLYATLGSSPLILFQTGANVAVAMSTAGGLGATRLSLFSAGSAEDIFIERDAADTLAQRRSTNPQAFRVYNTYTDASNYERAKMVWDSNVLRIGTEKAGTGSARALELQTDGVTRLTIDTSGHTIVTAGRQLFLSLNGVNWQQLDNQMRLNGGPLEMVERTAPSAPAANGVRIYAEDDGAGKTRLMALFATGAAQQIAIEP